MSDSKSSIFTKLFRTGNNMILFVSKFRIETYFPRWPPVLTFRLFLVIKMPFIQSEDSCEYENQPEAVLGYLVYTNSRWWYIYFDLRKVELKYEILSQDNWAFSDFKTRVEIFFDGIVGTVVFRTPETTGTVVFNVLNLTVTSKRRFRDQSIDMKPCCGW